MGAEWEQGAADAATRSRSSMKGSHLTWAACGPHRAQPHHAFNTACPLRLYLPQSTQPHQRTQDRHPKGSMCVNMICNTLKLDCPRTLPASASQTLMRYARTTRPYTTAVAIPMKVIWLVSCRSTYILMLGRAMHSRPKLRLVCRPCKASKGDGREKGRLLVCRSCKVSKGEGR